MRQLFKHVIAISLLAVLLISAGCASNTGIGTSTRTAPPVAPTAASPAPALMGQFKSNDSAYYEDVHSESSAGSVPGQDVDDRKIVRTGSLNLEVADISKSLDEIAAIASQYNGYVVSSNQRGDDDNPSGHISIRIPADKFDDALQKLKMLATKVTYETTNSQDVTEQYQDLQAQLKNYQATEAQYLELLKKADNVKDILEVQRELSNVRGSIERTKGRIQYIERTSDMSLVEIQLLKSKPIGQSTWDVGGIFKSAVDGLIVFSKVLLGILIWVLVFSPLWIIILIIIFVVIKKRNKAKLANPK